MVTIIETISSFANQWLGTALPKLFLLFLAILLCILVVAAVWDRRIKTLGASFGISIGILLLAFAFGESVASFFGGLDLATRMRLIAAFVSIAMLVLTAVTFWKTGLHLRYGVLWGGIFLLVLLTALFPGPLRVFPSILGVQYGLAIAVLGILFLLLLAFHLSVVVSELQDRQTYLLERVRLLEHSVFGVEKSDYPDATQTKHNLYSVLSSKLPDRLDLQSFSFKIPHGTALTAPIIILLAVGAVTLVGMLAPQVMIGDEVTHYYMMETQSKDLMAPNFLAKIPTGWGETEVRRYPHSFLWHYFGAVLFYISGGSFFIIQLYQALFLAQLLGVAYLLARSRGGVESRSALVYLLLVASLPMTLIFSVAFYQDVPMTAQVLTAFYLLRKNRWFLASLFLGFGLGLKVTAILFFPAFFSCLMVWTYKRKSVTRMILILSCSLLIVSGFIFGFSKILKEYGNATFYPAIKIEQIIKQVSQFLSTNAQAAAFIEHEQAVTTPVKKAKSVVSERMAEVIANHPGDLHIKSNYFVYGGGLLYLCFVGGVLSFFSQVFWKKTRDSSMVSPFWLWATGLSYLVFVAYFLRFTPDARFFFPGLMFCMLPIAERVVRLPKQRWIVIFITAVALVQSGYALAKTYHLRRVSPEINEAIHYLQEHPFQPRKVFMYPEGNYRLFPVPHEWYLHYYLRDFWRAGNDSRIKTLQDQGIGAVVIKKNLIEEVDSSITNLGVYPTFFVKDLSNDVRFVRLFENSQIIIYQVPDSLD